MVQDQIITQQVISFHPETTNQSFIDMHYILKAKGITNNKFFLVIYDTGLKGINPRDPNLSPLMKTRVLRECMINYWYFLREVVMIPDQGNSASGGVKYKLNRGNLAMNFLFILNYNMFVELPRQHGKTMAALCRYLWVFNFGTTNSKIMFIHKNHDGSKDNLAQLKRLRELLPSYLRMDSIISPDGKKIRVPNTVETLEHPTNHNIIKTLASAKNKALANNLGRGATMPLHYYDEFAFIIYNRIIYNAATPAYKTAAQNAKRNNSPYGILLTTTPGDLTTEEGNYAYDVRNSATPWNESYYDRSYQELEELRESNTNSSFFHVRFTYQQLGSGEQYFKEMVIDLQKDWAIIRREVLLEWAKTSSNCPFRYEDLEVIKQFCREPIRTIFFGRANQYQFLVYDELDPRYPPIIGVDVAGAMYQDSSAITVVDSKTTKTTATLNCNYMPSDDLAEVLYTLVSRYMQNAVVNIERNGGFGSSVIQRLMKTSIKRNLYYEIKDKVIEERYNGMKLTRSSQKVKVYGTDSTRTVRSRLIEILYERVNHHKDKFIAPILHSEMESMEVKKDGKVEHSLQSHDDQVFSYLMAMYVWYDGQNLMERFNIEKNTIRTDADLEEAIYEIEDFDERVSIDVDITPKDDTENVEKDLKDIVDESKKQVMFWDFERSEWKKDQECLMNLLQNDPYAREAYIRKNNIDPADISLGSMVNPMGGQITIPDKVFDDFNLGDDGEIVDTYHTGNLAGIFKEMGDY